MSKPKNRRGTPAKGSQLDVTIRGKKAFGVNKEIGSSNMQAKQLAAQKAIAKYNYKLGKQAEKTARTKIRYADNKAYAVGKGVGAATTPLASSVGSSATATGVAKTVTPQIYNSGAASMRKGYYGNPDDVEEMTDDTRDSRSGYTPA